MTSELDPTDEDRVAFVEDLRRRLGGRAVRALAASSHWSKTVVADIVSGRRLPSQDQLRDLLRAVDAAADEQAVWSGRLADLPTTGRAGQSMATPTVPSAQQADPRARKTWARQPRLLELAGAVTAVSAVLVAVAAVSAGRGDQGVSAAPDHIEASAELSGTPAPTGKGGNSMPAAIDHPADGTSVGMRSGVRLSGRVDGQPTGTYWLLDFDPDGTYTVDLPVEVLDDGSWTAVDAPLGDAGDVPARLTVLLVHADDSCATFLRREMEADDSTFATLPSGCEVHDRLGLVIDRP